MVLGYRKQEAGGLKDALVKDAARKDLRGIGENLLRKTTKAGPAPHPSLIGKDAAPKTADLGKGLGRPPRCVARLSRVHCWPTTAPNPIPPLTSIYNSESPPSLRMPAPNDQPTS